MDFLGKEMVSYLKRDKNLIMKSCCIMEGATLELFAKNDWNFKRRFEG